MRSGLIRRSFSSRPEASRVGLLAAVLAIFLAAGPAAASPAQQPPPERAEIQAALKIADLKARIKELERIKAAYPQSSLMASIDRNILGAQIDLCETLDEIDAFQRPLLSQGAGFARLDAFYFACDRIFRHRNLARFDKSRVTAVIEAYNEAYAKAAVDPAVLKDIPVDQRKYIASYTGSMLIYLARAYADEGRADMIVKTLERYREAGAVLDASYAYYKAEAAALRGRDNEAYEDYFTAAVDGYRDSEDKARAVHKKLLGTEAGFAAALEAKWRELPFHPEPFAAAEGGSGRTVLAELFTGSECPPCVAADLGFDGLLEAFTPKHLAVLEYHLPIPGPDPLMNPATKARQDYYGVTSTPTPFFDGERKFPGGGPRPRAEEKYKEYRGEIERRALEAAGVAIEARAVREAGQVRVSASFDKSVPGADRLVALVEKEARYRGSNGIVFHKMVVRGLRPLDPSARTAVAVFDLAGLEGAAVKHLEDYEKERGFTFKEKKAAADPANLAVVVFVQDRIARKVLNAAFADVR